MPQEITLANPPGTPPAQGPYSQAGIVTGGSIDFVAGQVSVGSDGSMVGSGDFAAQFHQVFTNIAEVLRGLGTDVRKIVKFTSYLVRSEDIATFTQLRIDHFPTYFGGPPYPPNTLLVIDRLAKTEFLLEVEAIAGLDRPPA